jgi:hypothetical protein
MWAFTDDCKKKIEGKKCLEPDSSAACRFITIQLMMKNKGTKKKKKRFSADEC